MTGEIAIRYLEYIKNEQTEEGSPCYIALQKGIDAIEAQEKRKKKQVKKNESDG